MKEKLQHTPEGLFTLMRRHPYLLTILLCGLLLPFGLADRANITAVSCIYLGVVLGAISVAAVFVFHLGRNRSEKLLLSGIMLACITASMLTIGFVKNKAFAIAIIALIVAAAAVLFIRFNYQINDTLIIAVLIALGIAIRFVYVLYTGVVDRQHDVGDFTSTIGHAGYIKYWYENGLKLPDFDVRSYWQYYHPPFHHWTMAALLKLLTMLGVSFDKASEAIQILPMLYSSLTMIVSYRVFRMVKLKGNPLIAAMAIICFHPTFIIFAGSFNNDMLLMLFMMAAILWGLRWYREPVMRNIIPLALCIGLGMMTKLSGWMVAPAVAFVFLIVLIKNIKKPLKYIGQFAVFGIICVPLGLWWQVRNLLKFHIPLTYVPDLGSNSVMYSGNMPLAQRLFSFGNGQLDFVYGSITFVGAPYNEYNPTLGLFKTAMFDECANSINDVHFPQIHVTGPILFWISVVLFLISFVCFIVSMIRKSDSMNGIERLYFSITFAVILVSYYLFCFAYPLSCTYNIRYAMPLIPLCAMGLALVLQRSESSQKPIATWLRRAMYALCAAFCCMSYVVYTQVAATM
ncbi:ArnT family glycosyltransferase [Ruminococcus sp.]|uniref:ArnT family glycosyltransferase n=1 Tax=Ruminococcus sp. TaxID=41978 RepID=UPI0038653FD3